MQRPKGIEGGGAKRSKKIYLENGVNENEKENSNYKK